MPNTARRRDSDAQLNLKGREGTPPMPKAEKTKAALTGMHGDRLGSRGRLPQVESVCAGG